MNQKSHQSLYIPIHFGKLATAFSKLKDSWLLANVDQELGWPKKKVLVNYRGRKTLLLPPTQKYYAAAAIIIKDGDLDEGKTFLMQFLSALAWYRPAKIYIVEWTGSTRQSVLQFLRLPFIQPTGMTDLFFRPTELPDPTDIQAQRALAFFREGLSLNHMGYSFLSY